jgi:hypothetical protein
MILTSSLLKKQGAELYFFFHFAAALAKFSPTLDFTILPIG